MNESYSVMQFHQVTQSNKLTVEVSLQQLTDDFLVLFARQLNLEFA